MRLAYISCVLLVLSVTPFISFSQNKTPGPLPGMEFVTIPAGSYQMGSAGQTAGGNVDEAPVHAVSVNSFHLQTTEVTQAQWVAVMGKSIEQLRDEAGPERPLKGTGDNNPIYYTSFQDVMEFMAKLNQLHPGKNYRLPSESEWEYACRAGTKTLYCNGDLETSLEFVGWYKKNAGGETHPVAQKKPNKWGLYDMHGNVWEWVEDGYHHTYEGSPNDGSAWKPTDDIRRVFRGGSWSHAMLFSRSAARLSGNPVMKYHCLGFRIAHD